MNNVIYTALIPLDHIVVPENWNMRSGAWEADEEFTALRESIKAWGGNKVPISLRTTPRNDDFVLVTGFRRVRALKLEKIDRALATVERMTDTEARLSNLIENVREDSKPADLVWALADLNRSGLGQAEIAARVGIVRSYVSVLVSLGRDLAPTVLEKWRASQIAVPISSMLPLRGLETYDQEKRWTGLLNDKRTQGRHAGQGSSGQPSRARRFGAQLGQLARFGCITISPDVDWHEVVKVAMPNLTPYPAAGEHCRLSYEETFKAVSLTPTEEKQP